MGPGRADRRPLRSAIGAAAGVALAAIGLIALRALLPDPVAGPQVQALRLLSLPAALVLAMVLAVMLARFSARAFDPLSDPVPRALALSQRVLANTVEQAAIFCPALLAAGATGTAARDLTAAALLFCAGRALFWAGYLTDPLLRAPGMAMTLAVNAALTASALLGLAAG
jgi:uncharacterized MAPEG superfamily protein